MEVKASATLGLLYVAWLAGVAGSRREGKVLDVYGNPVRYGQQLYIRPANSTLGGGFTFEPYHLYDYILLSPYPWFPGTPVHFGKAVAVPDDEVAVNITAFIYNSVSDWDGWNIWTVDTSRWTSLYVYLNKERSTAGEFTVQLAGDGTYVLRVCSSLELCAFLDTKLSGEKQWACASDEQAIHVIFEDASNSFWKQEFLS